MAANENNRNVKVKINDFVNSLHFKKQPVKIPKSLITFFVVLQMCFGVNAGMSQIFGEKKKKLMTIFSIFLSFAIIIVLVAPSTSWYDRIWMWCTFLKYSIDFISLNFTKYKIYDFLKDIHNLNGDIPAINRNLFGALILGYTLLMFIVKGCLLIVRCIIGYSIYCYGINYTYHGMVFYCCLSTDTISSILIVMRYYVYSYVVHMRNLLEVEFNLNDFEKRYVALAECCCKINQLSNRIIIIELLINTPRLMVTMWCMLAYIKNNEEWYSYISESVFGFHLAIQMCIPAVMAGMVNSQIDSIILILNEKRRVEKDQVKSEEIARVLRYIKARHLQSDIWRVIPVDLRLPIALLSLCTTYFIVMLQFTHLYD